jgi:hypothetical protein
MNDRDSEDGNSNPKNLETVVEDVLGDEEYAMQDTVPRTVANESAHEIGLEMHVFDEPASVAAAANEPIEQNVNTMEDVENHLDETYKGTVGVSSVEKAGDSLYLGLSANSDGYDIPLSAAISIEPSDKQYRGE